MYTCNKFGLELKEKIEKNESISDIQSWVYSMFFYDKDSLTPLLIKKLELLISKDKIQKILCTRESLENIAEEMISVKVDGLDKSSNEYLKIIFGEILKEKVDQLIPPYEIGRWAYDYYFNNMDILDDNFCDLLKTLGFMEDGPEFEYTYDKLNKIADDLMAGKDFTI